MSEQRRSLAFTRTAAVLITVGIGVASFVLSFAALRDLAARAGIPERLAWLWPLIVDGTILQATMAVVALAGLPDRTGQRRYFWIVLSSAAAVSVGANGLHAVVPGNEPLSPWLAAAIAVVAPVSLLAATHGLSLLIRLSAPSTADEPIDYEIIDDVPQGVSDAQPSGPTTAPEPAGRSPVAAPDLQPWEHVAEVIAARDAQRHVDVDDVAGVLHLRYEREMSHAAIGREMGIDRHIVDEIISAGSELLQSGDLSVERLAV